jgi:nucleotide-binding universal stress UspA family protein
MEPIRTMIVTCCQQPRTIMAYKTILVCLNEIARLPQLISVARDLGVRFNAHIAGLYVIPAVQVYPTDGLGGTLNFFDGTRVYFQDHLPKVKQAFESGMQMDKLSFETHVVDSALPSIANAMIDNSRNVDLVVISNTDRDTSGEVETDFVETFILAAGRPVLVLPHKGEVKFKADQIMVGWNDSRESSRAVFDAMPFLQKAKLTRLVTVDVPVGGTLPAASIAETLDRHGVKTEITDVVSEGASVGETLLRAANDYGADLVVLGAYGHSRFSEMVFGGATRHILRNLERPIFMSH